VVSGFTFLGFDCLEKSEYRRQEEGSLVLKNHQRSLERSTLVKHGFTRERTTHGQDQNSCKEAQTFTKQFIINKAIHRCTINCCC
jgi:hypothetical protein